MKHFFLTITFFWSLTASAKSLETKEIFNEFKDFVCEFICNIEEEPISIHVFEPAGPGFVCNPLASDCSMQSIHAYMHTEEAGGPKQYVCMGWVDQKFKMIKKLGFYCGEINHHKK